MPKKSKRAQHPSARPFQDRIPIPAALNTGAVVGQLGSNVKWISRESGGAWIFVKDDHAHISANDAGTLARARQLLKAQFKAAIQVGTCAYPHPKRVDSVLLRAFAAPLRVTLSPRQDEVAAATGYKCELLQLAPFGQPQQPPPPPPQQQQQQQQQQRQGAEAHAAGVTSCPPAAISTPTQTTHSPSPKRPRINVSHVGFWTADDGGLANLGAALAATALEAAAEAAAEARPAETAQAALDTESGASGGAGGGNGSSNGEGGGDGAGGAGSGDSSSEGAHPTLRFNLGKQLYYEVPPQLRVEARVQGLDLQELQAASAQQRKVFSNTVTASQYDTVRAWLRNQRGFRLEGSREAAHVWVLNRRLNIKYLVSLDLSSPQASVRKVRPAASSRHFIAFLGGPQQPDLRIKLMTGGRDLWADPEIRRVAEALAAHVSTHGFAATVAAGAQGAGLGADLELESPARKSEELFVGEVKAGDGCSQPLELRLSRVETATEAVEYHVSGTLPEADKQLRLLLDGHQQQPQRQQQQQQAHGTAGEGSGEGVDGGGSEGGVRATAEAGECSGEPAAAQSCSRREGSWAEGVVRTLCAFAEDLGQALEARAT